ncbi:hypothetical protein D3C87_2005770 [compost metagenome]
MVFDGLFGEAEMLGKPGDGPIFELMQPENLPGFFRKNVETLVDHPQQFVERELVFGIQVVDIRFKMIEIFYNRPFAADVVDDLVTDG